MIQNLLSTTLIPPLMPLRLLLQLAPRIARVSAVFSGLICTLLTASIKRPEAFWRLDIHKIGKYKPDTLSIRNTGLANANSMYYSNWKLAYCNKPFDTQKDTNGERCTYRLLPLTGNPLDTKCVVLHHDLDSPFMSARMYTALTCTNNSLFKPWQKWKLGK